MTNSQALFKGNVSECLKHYSSHFGVDGPTKQERSEITDFVGSPDSTVFEWLNREKIPSGERFIRVREFLSLKGYQVTELEHLVPEVRDACILLSLGVVEISELTQELGYSKCGSILEVLRGSAGISLSKKAILSDLVTQRSFVHSESIQNKLLPFGKTATSRIAIPKKKTRKSGVSSLESKKIILSTLQHLIETAVPLARIIISDDFSDEERRTLRESTKDDGVFELSNILNGLCSRKAREIVLNQNNHNTVQTREGV